MAEVRIEPIGAIIDVREGETLLAAAWREGYRWPSTCEGKGRCRLCFVEVLEGVDALDLPSEWEREGLAELEQAYPDDRPKTMRLACQIRPVESVQVFKRGVRAPQR